uniref:caspase recruitment domain-containing protein 9 n=1 Tax=Euleptes europaea TaxID=460621 RepID=UPI002541A4D2|nr:caspase recruitment domain-containing protein 9 [Euleptes europaea]
MVQGEQHFEISKLMAAFPSTSPCTSLEAKEAKLCCSPSEPEDDDESCWSSLENFRVKLISVIDPSKITPYLRQCRVINHDDEEQILNDPSLVIRKRKTGVLLDILQRTGQKGFVAFLESLELYYPHLYKKITGNEPSRVFSMIIDTAGESSLTELLMKEITKLQGAVHEERRDVQELSALLHAKDDLLKEMRVKDSVLRKHQERAHKMKEERDNLSKELKQCKDENYKLAMSYARQSEEKNVALMKNRDLQLEVDLLRHSLLKAEDNCKLQRKHTLRWKHATEQRPSHEAVWEIQREKDLLLAKNKELESTLQVTKTSSAGKESGSSEALEAERARMLGEHRELVNAIYDLRQLLRGTEDTRDKLIEEKEMLELRCASLQNDTRIYQDRLEAVLKQMEEVAAERDQALLTQEAFHKQHCKNLMDKDGYRKQIRDLGEKCDELQLQLFQQEGQLLSAVARMKRLHLDPLALTSDLEETSSRSSQDEGGPLEQELAEKGRRRMKDSFEHYRRKRALRRVPKGRYHEVDWENTTGSDNTDTEGS